MLLGRGLKERRTNMSGAEGPLLKMTHWMLMEKCSCRATPCCGGRFDAWANRRVEGCRIVKG